MAHAEETASATDHVAAGYFATRRIPRPEWMPGTLLPPKILTLTEHVAPRLPGNWLLEGSGDREVMRCEAMRRLGIPMGRRDEIVSWALARFGRDWDMDGVCLTPGFASEAARRFLPRDPDTVVMGLALPVAFASEFLAAASDDVARGVQPDLAGVAAMVANGRTPAPGGEPLGYDFYPWKHGLECSWLCEEVLADVEADLGVRLNAHGLVTSLADAEAVTNWLGTRQERVETELGLWLPFLVLRYR